MEKRPHPGRDPHFPSAIAEAFRRARQATARPRLLRHRLSRQPRRESSSTGRLLRRAQSPRKFPRLESREIASREMSGDLIVREQEPLNLEMPFSSLDGFITPNESFYVRCHFPVPEITASDWRLKIEGDVETPYELSYDDVREMER